MMTNLRKLSFLLLLSSLLFVGRVCAVEADEKVGGIVEEAQEAMEDVADQIYSAYDKLPPQGKFIAGAGVGFVGSRIVVKGAVTTAKVAGAAFIVGEVLNYSGALENMTEKNQDLIHKVKNSALKSVSNLRSEFRRRLNPAGIRNTIEEAVTTEKMAAFGFATGAFVGFMI